MVVLPASVTIIRHSIILARVTRPVQANKGSAVGSVVVHLRFGKVLGQSLVARSVRCRDLETHAEGVLNRVKSRVVKNVLVVIGVVLLGLRLMSLMMLDMLLLLLLLLVVLLGMLLAVLLAVLLLGMLLLSMLGRLLRLRQLWALLLSLGLRLVLLRRSSVRSRSRHALAMLVALLLLSLVLLLLGVHTRRVTASIFTKVDLELLVLVLLLDALNSLDGVSKVGEVHECTRLFLEKVDLLNVAKLREIRSQLRFGPVVVNVANVNVSRSTCSNGQSDRGREGPGVLAPANLEALVVDCQALEVGQGEELGGSSGIHKGHKANVTLRDVPNVVQKTSSHHVTDLLSGGLGMDITEVHRSVASVANTSSSSSHGISGRRLLRENVGESVSVGSGSHLLVARSESKVLGGVLLLGFADVGTSILAVVHLSLGPDGVGLELLNDLDGGGNRQKVHKAVLAVANKLHGVNRAKFSQLIAKGGLVHLIRQIS